MSVATQAPGSSKAALAQLVAIEVALLTALAPTAGWVYALVAGVAVAVITNWWPGIRPFAAVAVIVLVMTSPSALLAAVAIAALMVYAVAVLAEERSSPLWSRATAIGLGAALAALVLVLLFSGLRYEPPSGSSSQASGFEQAQPEGVEPGEDQDDLLGRLIDAVRRFFTSDDGQEAAVGGGTPAEESSDINWWRILLVAAVVVALAILAWLLWRWLRRRRQANEDAGPGWAVRRLDRIGARTLRPRRPSETPSAYGDDLHQRARDGRLGDAGRLVSDLLYRPRQAGPGPAEAEVRSALDNLEQHPPDKVRDERRGGRLGRWRRGNRPDGNV